jgi:hypothetical protein
LATVGQAVAVIAATMLPGQADAKEIITYTENATKPSVEFDWCFPVMFLASAFVPVDRCFVDFLLFASSAPGMSALPANFVRLAPAQLELPTCKRYKLAYEPGSPPVLAVRIQELFGVRETPRLAGGRVPVLLHLLGPNHRLLVPAAALGGAAFLVVCDLVARLALGAQEINVGIVTALVGAPYFVFLLLRSVKRGIDL